MSFIDTQNVLEELNAMLQARDDLDTVDAIAHTQGECRTIVVKEAENMKEIVKGTPSCCLVCGSEGARGWQGRAALRLNSKHFMAPKLDERSQRARA